MARSKLVESADAAVEAVEDGMTIMLGGFAGWGAPWTLVYALARRRPRDLTVIQTACNQEIVPLLEAGMVRKVITSWPVYASRDRRSEFEELWRAGKVELELVPQGTLAERIRAGGAGIPAFFTPTGVGTVVAEGKRTEEFDGRIYLLERSLYGDVAIVNAHMADTAGNLVYRGSSRSFNQIMASAARVTIAEATTIVETGELDPERVGTPGLFVTSVVQKTVFARQEG